MHGLHDECDRVCGLAQVSGAEWRTTVADFQEKAGFSGLGPSRAEDKLIQTDPLLMREMSARGCAATALPPTLQQK